MKIVMVGRGKMGKNMAERLASADHEVVLVEDLADDPGLVSVSGYAEDSGEGRWTVEEALAAAVPTPAITAALFARFTSRQDESPAMKAVAALRKQFGGHAVRAS